MLEFNFNLELHSVTGLIAILIFRLKLQNYGLDKNYGLGKNYRRITFAKTVVLEFLNLKLNML